MYAVVVSGGRQYRVREGDSITVDLLAADEGASVTLPQVLLVGGEGAELKVGTPSVEGAVVTAAVVRHFRGQKRETFKFLRTRRRRVRRGFRPDLTELTITSIKA